MARRERGAQQSIAEQSGASFAKVCFCLRVVLCFVVAPDGEHRGRGGKRTQDKMSSALRQENGGGSQRSASSFKAMLPSQGQTSAARKAGANGLRESNSTSFRFFSNQDDVQAKQKPSTTNRSELAACLDETSRMLK